MRAMVPVDLVSGPPPNPREPWRHAVSAEIADLVWAQAVIRTADDIRSINLHDVFAVQIADQAAAANVRPHDTYLQHGRACDLTVTLDGIEPPIWRRLVVAA